MPRWQMGCAPNSDCSKQVRRVGTGRWLWLTTQIDFRKVTVMKTNVLVSLALVAALALGFWAGRHVTQRLESDGGWPANLPPIQTSSTTAKSGAAYLAEGTPEK